ncbi:HAM group protein [Tieghemostelium lacteum]|uniref:HAM group protein n=1 Tax=Tieghemostelium lacteum TaxID=361077 RepID=A0A151ZCC6_TIELA|nr:HAM group protein [Tieghemostelium lacteum]|eukprot:KYQ91589.1 HAM group protein [Tieghemostelium lacteum]
MKFFGELILQERGKDIYSVTLPHNKTLIGNNKNKCGIIIEPLKGGDEFVFGVHAKFQVYYAGGKIQNAYLTNMAGDNSAIIIDGQYTFDIKKRELEIPHHSTFKIGSYQFKYSKDKTNIPPLKKYKEVKFNDTLYNNNISSPKKKNEEEVEDEEKEKSSQEQEEKEEEEEGEEEDIEKSSQEEEEDEEEKEEDEDDHVNTDKQEEKSSQEEEEEEVDEEVIPEKPKKPISKNVTKRVLTPISSPKKNNKRKEIDNVSPSKNIKKLKGSQETSQTHIILPKTSPKIRPRY